jgi:hypothetical protein
MAFLFYTKSYHSGGKLVKEKEKCGEILTLKFIFKALKLILITLKFIFKSKTDIKTNFNLRKLVDLHP